jgi:hypothetical protein
VLDYVSADVADRRRIFRQFVRASSVKLQGNEFRLTQGIFIRLHRICCRLGCLVRRQMRKKLHAIRVHRRWNSTWRICSASQNAISLTWTRCPACRPSWKVPPSWASATAVQRHHNQAAPNRAEQLWRLSGGAHRYHPADPRPHRRQRGAAWRCRRARRAAYRSSGLQRDLSRDRKTCSRASDRPRTVEGRLIGGAAPR